MQEKRIDIPRVIGALHLLPSEVSARPDSQPLNKIIDHALLHAQIAHDAGVRAFYIQDVHDVPVAPTVLPQTISNVTSVGKELRRAFPNLVLGVCLMQHAAKEPLRICDDIGGQFVRIKVYTGAMVKAEGLLQGIAHEAIHTRHALGAHHIKIFADVYDRVGMPLAPLPLGEAARQAVQFGRADALVVTGFSHEHTLQMLDEVNAAKIDVPVAVGGGVSMKTLGDLNSRAKHFIVNSSWARRDLPNQNGTPVEWDGELIRAFMERTTKDG